MAADLTNASLVIAPYAFGIGSGRKSYGTGYVPEVNGEPSDMTGFTTGVTGYIWDDTDKGRIGFDGLNDTLKFPNYNVTFTDANDLSFVHEPISDDEMDLIFADLLNDTYNCLSYNGYLLWIEFVAD